MNSSDDELPEIPGTKYPWMNLEKQIETGSLRMTSKRYFCMIYLLYLKYIFLQHCGK